VLIDDGARASSAVEKSPVPAEHQIRGLGPIFLTVHDLARTEQVLTGAMNMRRVRDLCRARGADPCVCDGRGRPAAELHVIESTDLSGSAAGAGGVHHVAFAPRTKRNIMPDAAAQRTRQPQQRRIDRFYFRSLYFAEPNASCLRSPPTGPASPPTSRWKRSARNWRCRRFSNRAARKSKPG